MEKELQTFKHAEFGEVRAYLIDDVPYFVGKDVATILGYKNSNKAITDHVAEEDKIEGVTIRYPLGGKQKPISINESGLYSLILSSHMPQAKVFKRWVTSEVLPSIRKHGAYVKEDLLDNPDLLLDVIAKLKEEKAKRLALEEEVKKTQEVLESQAPRLNYLDSILKNPNTIKVTHIAKDYGMGPISFNSLLNQLGVQYRLKGCWVIKEPYSGRGYAKQRTYKIGKNLVFTLEWTQKGRQFLYDFLKKRGYLPVIERYQS